jgi:transposase
MAEAPEGVKEPTRRMCWPRSALLYRTLRVAQTMVYVLNVLWEVAPEWVLTHVPAEWVERSGQRLEEERLPKEGSERLKLANQVGADGWMLLHALQAAPTPEWMQTLPAVTTLQSSLRATI